MYGHLQAPTEKQIGDQTKVCVDGIYFQTHTQLLFLTPWVHISMVTSMFVYLFPDFFFFFFFLL